MNKTTPQVGTPQRTPINNEIIPYKLKRSLKAKYIRLQISSSGLEVVLPLGYSIKEAEDFISKKRNWIKKHRYVEETKTKSFQLFGNEIKILQSFDLFNKKHRLTFRNGILNIISPSQSRIEVETLFTIWLKNYSKKYIVKRAELLAERFRFELNKITIRGQKTRWGSCSSKGNLSFNFKLMQFRREIIDYVIIHELCHLKEMNHSHKFWTLVERFCPDYKMLKSELKAGAGI